MVQPAVVYSGHFIVAYDTREYASVLAGGTETKDTSILHNDEKQIIQDFYGAVDCYCMWHCQGNHLHQVVDVPTLVWSKALYECAYLGCQIWLELCVTHHQVIQQLPCQVAYVALIHE